MKTLIVLPAYNEAPVLGRTLVLLRESTDADILVVDDGSVDATGRIARRMRVGVVRHVVNMGLGAAIKTGFEAAKRGGYDVMVTFDADGQHDPGDIKVLLKALRGADVVIGARTRGIENMPFLKRVGNFALNMLTGLFFGIFSSDSQSGLRAFNRIAIESISIRASKYEVSSEILYEARRNGLRLREVPVEVIYSEHSKARGTKVSDGFKIFWRMILHQRC